MKDAPNSSNQDCGPFHAGDVRSAHWPAPRLPSR
jgi:hypothetical protein